MTDNTTHQPTDPVPSGHGTCPRNYPAPAWDVAYLADLQYITLSPVSPVRQPLPPFPGPVPPRRPRRGRRVLVALVIIGGVVGAGGAALMCHNVGRSTPTAPAVIPVPPAGRLAPR